jgi:hypothetical protein
MNWSLRFLFLATLFAAIGCGRESGSDSQPVSGEVIYDGKPAAGVMVFFMPSQGAKVPGAPANPHAVTDENGRFALSTFGESDGAPAGNYRVVLIWPKLSEETEESPPDRLFGWFDARHTTLEVTVSPGSNDLRPFKLKAVNGAPPASEGIPGRN